MATTRKESLNAEETLMSLSAENGKNRRTTPLVATPEMGPSEGIDTRPGGG
jgi:hypothetical protein